MNIISIITLYKTKLMPFIYKCNEDIFYDTKLVKLKVLMLHFFVILQFKANIL